MFWLCVAGVNYRPHGVRRVPLRLAGVGSTTSLPPQRGPSEISLRGSNYFQSPPPLRLTPQLQKMSSFSGTEMGATTLPRPLPPPPPHAPSPVLEIGLLSAKAKFG